MWKDRGNFLLEKLTKDCFYTNYTKSRNLSEVSIISLLIFKYGHSFTKFMEADLFSIEQGNKNQPPLELL